MPKSQKFVLPSRAQYQKSLKSLSEQHKEILKTLYLKGPFEDSNVIADALGYKNFNAANLQIGTIGRRIAEILKIKNLPSYDDYRGIRPAYFLLVHNFFEDGWDLNQNLFEAIKIDLNPGYEDIALLPTEIPFSRYAYIEGKAISVFVNRYERDKKAREKCLTMKGSTCLGCGIDFKEVYGKDIPDIIEVHHLRELSKIGREELKNVFKDLVPLCPNCHAVVHSGNKLMSIENLRLRLKRKDKISLKSS